MSKPEATPPGAVTFADSLMRIQMPPLPKSTLLPQPVGFSNFGFSLAPDLNCYAVLSNSLELEETKRVDKCTLYCGSVESQQTLYDVPVPGNLEAVRLQPGGVCLLKSVQFLPEGAPLDQRTGTFYYTAFDYQNNSPMLTCSDDLSHPVFDFTFHDLALLLLRKEHSESLYSVISYTPACEPATHASFRLDVLLQGLLPASDYSVYEAAFWTSAEELYMIVGADAPGTHYLCHVHLNNSKASIIGKADSLIRDIHGETPLGTLAIAGTEKTSIVDVATGQILLDEVWAVTKFHCWDSKRKALYYSASPTGVQELDMKERKQSPLYVYRCDIG